MDTCKGLAVGYTVENSSVPKGWVIGPLFQSFKSKMASFTEIVLSPVKLFRASSPPPSMDHPHKLCEFELQADGTSDVESKEPSNMFLPKGLSENRNQDDKTNQNCSLSQMRLSDGESEQNGKTVPLIHSRILDFDDECAITQNGKISVPLPHNPLPCIVSEQVSEPVGSVIRSSILLQPSLNVSALHESKLKISSVVEEQKGKLSTRVKPLPRKRTGKRCELKKVTSKTLVSEVKKEDPEASDEPLSHVTSVKSNKADSRDIDKTLSLCSSVCYTQPDADWLHRDGFNDARKVESGRLVRQSLQSNFNNDANEGTLNPALDTQHLECQQKPETCSAAGLGRAKRAVKLDCHSQDLVTRKRLKADRRTEDTNNRELLNVASDSGILKGIRALTKEVVSPDTILDEEEALKPARKRQAVSTRANRKGKGGQEMLAALNEKVLHMQTECASDAMSVCSLKKSNENNQKGVGSKVKPSGSCKRLKTRTGLGKPDVDTDDRMDVETTMGITCTKQAQQAQLSDQSVNLYDIKQLQRSSKCRNINKKPRKQKSLNQAATKSDSTSASISSELSVEPLELTPTDLCTSQHVEREESWETGLSRPTKKPKRDCKNSAKFSASVGIEETKQCNDNLPVPTKESQPQESKDKISTDPVYFEMTPFESNPQPAFSPSPSHLNCCVKLNVFNNITDGEKTSTCPAGPEAGNHSSINVSRLRSSARRVNVKPRRADNQRRKCRVLHSRTHTGEEVTNSVTMEEADLTTGAGSSETSSFSRRLLRSYSCPEISSFHPHDTTCTSALQSPQHIRIHTSHQSTHTPFVPHAHKSLQRARRHTVSSVEVEREIAPLCLRKEVYPSRRSASYDGVTQHLSPSLALSPSASFSALASCFLSSPLAFLSKKIDSRSVAASPGASTHISSPTTSSSTSPLSSSAWHHPGGFFLGTDSSGASLDSSSRLTLFFYL